MDDRVRRRQLLAALGAVSSSTLAGCSEYVWSRAENTAPEQIALQLKTVPADDDLKAARIANHLTESLRTAGIDTDHIAMDEPELHREVLIERDFDLFVMRYPGIDEVDSLRSLLHSDYVGEQGWQNPFSFSDPTADDYLDDQRQVAGTERENICNDLFEYLVEDDMAPYTVVAYHDHLGAVRSELPTASVPSTPQQFLETVSNAPSEEATERPLRIGLFGQQLIGRLNPIAVDLSDVSVILDLLYDPLVRKVDTEYQPWLAESIEWEQTERTVEATVTLHDDLQWHDGEPIDADDVQFTTAFLADTSLGEAESPVPAPRYRGRQSLIEETTVIDERSVRVSFGTASQEVANWGFTIPLLPAHIWNEHTDLDGDHRTEALTWDNDEPVGSGLFRYVDSEQNESLTLEVFDDHVFLRSDDEPPDDESPDDESPDDESPDDESPNDESEVDTHGDESDTESETEQREHSMSGSTQDIDETSFDGLEYHVLPNAGAALDALRDGDIDIIGNELPIDRFEDIDTEDEILGVTQDTSAFYMIGYNLRHASLGNRRFRGVVSRLVDRDYVVEEFFDGHATIPDTHSSFVGVRRQNWDSHRSASGYGFPGTDGELDTDLTRELFEDAGYNYVNDELVE